MSLSFEVLQVDFIRDSTATFTQKSHKTAVKTTLRYIGFAFFTLSCAKGTNVEDLLIGLLTRPLAHVFTKLVPPS